MNNRFITLIAFVIYAVFFISCSEKEDFGKVPVSVRLTDAPGDYEEVNVEIVGVQVNSGDGGWISLENVNSGIYNLLDYTNGVDTEIASDLLPVGKLSQIRLILGENNSVKVNGQIFNLNTPSAQQSGLKLQVNTTFKENTSYSMLLDFDASRSVVKTGDGKFILKPVIRVITAELDGAISGQIIPSEVKPAIMAIAGTDSVGTYSDDQGNFLIKGLKTGKYKVVVVPNSQFQEVEINDVEVSMGMVTDIGEVTLDAK